MDILIAQVAKYENQAVEDGLGNIIGTIKNDMDALTLATSGEMVDLAGRMIKNKKGETVQAIRRVFCVLPKIYGRQKI